MELFSFSATDTPLLLSASESGLFVYPVHNERFGHPILLCSNYKSDLSGCIYNDSLYYAYINKENSLLLRRLHESTLLFRLNGTGTVLYHSPRLVTVGNSLFLFYFEAERGCYRLKLHLPVSEADIPLPEAFCTYFREPPYLSLQTAEQFLYIFLTAGATHISCRYSKVTGFEPLYSESGLRLPWETEKKQLEQGLIQALHLSEQQQNLLADKEQKLQLSEEKVAGLSAELQHTKTLLSHTDSTLQTVQKQLADCQQNGQQTAQTLEHTTLLLERAKSQYNELMRVAEQYRQEAIKWYGKFTDKH